MSDGVVKIASMLENRLIVESNFKDFSKRMGLVTDYLKPISITMISFVLI